MRRLDCGSHSRNFESSVHGVEQRVAAAAEKDTLLHACAGVHVLHSMQRSDSVPGQNTRLDFLKLIVAHLEHGEVAHSLGGRSSEQLMRQVLQKHFAVLEPSLHLVLVEDRSSIRERETKLAFNDGRGDLEQCETRSVARKVSRATTLASLADHSIRELEKTLLVLQVAVLAEIVETHLHGDRVRELCSSGGRKCTMGEESTSVISCATTHIFHVDDRLKDVLVR